MKTIRKILATPGHFFFNMFYSMLITGIIMYFINDSYPVGKFFIGPFMALVTSISVQLNIGQIIKYIDENGSLVGFRKKQEIPTFWSYIAYLGLAVFSLLIHFDGDFTELISLSLPIGLCVGVIVTTLGATIMFRNLPWLLKPDSKVESE